LLEIEGRAIRWLVAGASMEQPFWSEKHKAFIHSFGGDGTSRKPGFIPAVMPNKIDERFAKFHAKNPQVFEKLVELCWEIKAHGFKRYSVRTLWETMRWHFSMKVQKTGKFALNDALTSRYARKLMNDIPAFAGMFETRELKS
jgi:hypothetical protein